MTDGWRGEAGEEAEELHDEMAEELDPVTGRETFERQMAEEERPDEAGEVGDTP